MIRNFAMVSLSLQYQEGFQSLSMEDRLLILVILISEDVDLKGYGKCNVASLCEVTGLSAKVVKAGLIRLAESGFICFNLKSGNLIVRNWWDHTRLNFKGLSSLLKEFKDGRLRRSLAEFELPWLKDWVDALGHVKSAAAEEARRLAIARIAEIESAELRSQAEAKAKADEELSKRISLEDAETKAKFADILSINLNKRKEA